MPHLLLLVEAIGDMVDAVSGGRLQDGDFYSFWQWRRWRIRLLRGHLALPPVPHVVVTVEVEVVELGQGVVAVDGLGLDLVVLGVVRLPLGLRDGGHGAQLRLQLLLEGVLVGGGGGGLLVAGEQGRHPWGASYQPTSATSPASHGGQDR